MLYKTLDYFFFIFHTFLIIFNTCGWIFPKFRKLNLLTLLLTAFSWFILGICFGWGYCVCTDWHWDVRQHLGYNDMSNSYNHFLILKLTGINLSEMLVDIATVCVFVSSLILSVIVNIKDYKKKINN